MEALLLSSTGGSSTDRGTPRSDERTSRSARGSARLSERQRLREGSDLVADEDGMDAARAWLLENQWSFADLLELLGGAEAALQWPQFRERAAAGMASLAPAEVEGLFRQASALGSVPGLLHASDLVHLLQEPRGFREAMVRSWAQLLQREAERRQLDPIQLLCEASSRLEPHGTRQAVAWWVEQLCPGRLAGADLDILAGHVGLLVQECCSAAPEPRPPPLGDGFEAFERACHRLRQLNAVEPLRRKLRQLAAAGGSEALPTWLSWARAMQLLREYLPEEELLACLRCVASASAAYHRPPLLERCGGGGGGGQLLRAETLLSCAELCHEHILEVKLDMLHGVDALRSASAVPTADASDLFLRCHLHGMQQTVQTTPIIGGAAAQQVSCKLDFGARYCFSLCANDCIEELYQGVAEALSIEVWCSGRGLQEQMLFVGLITGAELSSMLSEDAMDGHRREWHPVLALHAAVDPATAERPGAASVAMKISHSRQPGRPDRPPLPWQAEFRGRSVLCAVGQAPARAVEEHHRGALPGRPAETLRPERAGQQRGPDLRLNVALQDASLCLSPLRELALRWLQTIGILADVIHKLSCYIFVQLCLCSARSSCCDGLQRYYVDHVGVPQRSPPQLVQLFEPLPEASRASGLLSIPLDYSWSAMLPSLDEDRPLDHRLSLELWLRVGQAAEEQTCPSSLSRELRLAEQSIPLDPLLLMSQVEDVGPVRIAVPCEGDDESRLARVDLRLGLAADAADPEVCEIWGPEAGAAADGGGQLDTGGAERRQRAQAPDAGCSPCCTIQVCEIWFSTSTDLGQDSRRTGPRALQGEEGETDLHHYVEVALWRRSRKGQSHHLMPARVIPVGGTWRRLLFEKELLPQHWDVMHQQADEVIELTLFRLFATGRKSVASAQFELAPAVPPGCRTSHWLVLSCQEAQTPVARALVVVQSGRAADAEPLGLEPAGIALPLGDLSQCKVKVSAPARTGLMPWPWLQSTVGEKVCTTLLRCELELEEPPPEQRHGDCCRVVRAEDFAAALAASGYRADLEAFRAAAPHLFRSGRSLVPYIPMLCWLAIRLVARALAPSARRFFLALSQHDLTRSGFVPLASLRSILPPWPPSSASHGSSSSSAGGPSQPSPWLFVEHWPGWVQQRAGRALFDYIVLLNDAHLSVPEHFDLSLMLDEGAAPPGGLAHCAAGEGALRRAAEAAAASVTVANALHLPLVQQKCPNVFVSFAWSRPARLQGPGFVDCPPEPRGELGRTEVIYRTTCPAWDYAATVELPSEGSLSGCGGPGALHDAELELRVWHVESPAKECGKVLIGTVLVPLAPLGRGFPEVDGYFHVEAPPRERGSAWDTGREVTRGQLRVKVRPCFAPSGEVSRSALLLGGGAAAELGSEMQPRLTTLGPAAGSEVGLSPPPSLGAPSSPSPGRELGQDVMGFSEVAVRLGSELFRNEAALREMGQAEGEEELLAVRESHRQNMVELDELQRRLRSHFAPAAEAPAPSARLEEAPAQAQVQPSEPSESRRRFWLPITSTLGTDGDASSLAGASTLSDQASTALPRAAAAAAAAAAAGPLPPRLHTLRESPKALLRRDQHQHQGAGPLPEAAAESGPLPCGPTKLDGLGPIRQAPLAVQEAAVPEIEEALPTQREPSPPFWRASSDDVFAATQRLLESSPGFVPRARRAWLASKGLASKSSDVPAPLQGPAAPAAPRDAACQTDFEEAPPRRHESPPLRVSRPCQTSGEVGSGAAAPAAAAPALSSPSLLNASASTIWSPPQASEFPGGTLRIEGGTLRIEGGSDGASLASTAPPPLEVPRCQGKWVNRLDVQTQRIARIMQGSTIDDDHEESWSCASD